MVPIPQIEFAFGLVKQVAIRQHFRGALEGARPRAPSRVAGTRSNRRSNRRETAALKEASGAYRLDGGLDEPRRGLDATSCRVGTEVRADRKSTPPGLSAKARGRVVSVKLCKLAIPTRGIPLYERTLGPSISTGVTMQFTPGVMQHGDPLGQHLSTLIDLHDLGAPPELQGSKQCAETSLCTASALPTASSSVPLAMGRRSPRRRWARP